MKPSLIADIHLACVTCAQGFVFSAGEQELQQLRGIRRTPEHCPACTKRALRGPAAVMNPAE